MAASSALKVVFVTILEAQSQVAQHSPFVAEPHQLPEQIRHLWEQGGRRERADRVKMGGKTMEGVDLMADAYA